MVKPNSFWGTLNSYQRLPRFLTWTGVLLLVVASGLWWSKVYSNPRRVFDAMLSNSLSTSSVTRHVQQKNQGGSLDQYIQLRLGSQNRSRNITALGQGTGTEFSTVKTESIGTQNEDYTRYISIDTKEKNAAGKQIEFNNIVGIWAKSDEPQSGQKSSARYLNESLLGIIPAANLEADQRKDLLRLIDEKKVFDIDFSTVTQKWEKGRKVYTYSATIKPQSYIPMLQVFTKAVGLGEVEGLEQSNYEGVAPLEVKLGVDVLSRELIRVVYEGNGRVEDYSGYGLKNNIDIPGQTITASELQQRLQTLR